MKELKLYRYIAICSQETVDVVAQELLEKGAKKVTPEYAAVHFEADLETSYRLHLTLQTASRLLLVLRQGSGSSLPVITNQSRRVRWDEYFKKDSTYLIEGITGDRGPDKPTATLISKAVRHGLEDYFQKNGLPIPKVDLKEPKIRVVAYLWNGELTISIDSSGKSLHKRGYRLDNHPAPLKENLAAALLRLAGFDGSQNFYDPMCGSGTIAVEAAFMALHKAPLIHRKKGDFGFEHLKEFDAKLWRDIQDECRSQKQAEPSAQIFAADIDPRYITAAKDNALRARVEKYIQFKQGSFFDLPAPAENGIILCNLPYGERVTQKGADELLNFYKQIGDTLKQKYAGWTAALLVSEETPFKFIGLKPKRKIPIDNGGIPCKLLIFQLYAGKKFSQSNQDV